MNTVILVYGNENVRRLQGLYNSIRVAIKSLSDRERKERVMAVMVVFPFLLTSFNHAIPRHRINPVY